MVSPNRSKCACPQCKIISLNPRSCVGIALLSFASTKSTRGHRSPAAWPPSDPAPAAIPVSDNWDVDDLNLDAMPPDELYPELSLYTISLVGLTLTAADIEKMVSDLSLQRKIQKDQYDLQVLFSLPNPTLRRISWHALSTRKHIESKRNQPH